MQKRLTKHGNSLALVIEKPILELLGADADTVFDITTNGRELVLSPAQSPERRKKFEQAKEATLEQYADTFKRLAE